MAFARLKALWGKTPGGTMRALYAALVAEARNPVWYQDCGVPDTLDGRFEMVTLLVSMAMLRMEGEGEGAREPMALLTECFVADMEAQVREIGFGDVVVGKHVGKMVSALGGRIGQLRATQEDEAARAAFLQRTVLADQPVTAAQSQALHRQIESVSERLSRTALDVLLAGKIAA